MKKFGVIGAAGYIAPKHMKAIHDTGNDLVVAFDTNDSVGVLDNYFPQSSFFTEFERFDRYVDKLRESAPLDFISICSPNYLHDSHIRFALRSNVNAICEKPLVINPWNIDRLYDLENESNKKINTILQLRLHPSIVKLKKKIDNLALNSILDLDLTYITSRGKWYFISWKGDEEKSGGIVSNIGIHFFDMLGWIFGNVKKIKMFLYNKEVASGYIEFERARVRWFLSVNSLHLPHEIQENKQSTYRSITIDGKEIEFSDGFKDLHTLSYKQILNGKGFLLDDVKPVTNLISDIRNAPISEMRNDYHPFLRKIKSSYD